MLKRFYLSLIALLGLCGAVAFGNYALTQGTGTTFGSIVVAGVQYAQQLFCDPTTPGQCAAVSSVGALKVDNSAVTQPISASALPLPTGAATNSELITINSTLGSPLQTGGAVTANAGTNLNTSALALETGGNLAQIVTDIGAPGSTVCSTDTASCNTNQQMQRLAQRLTSIVTALGSPFQAGGSIANTTFASTQSGTWTVQPGNTANTTPWLVTAGQSGTWNITNISGTVSLPTGASTAAKQPAIGTAGTASADILTVQGIASMTPLLVTLSGTNNINNISGTISLPTGAATAANQINAAQKTQIVDGSGSVIASTSNNLNVQCANCSGSGASAVDEATFTAGTSVLAPGGGFFQTTATSNPLTTGQQGMVQMTANRAFFTNIRNASGTEVGTFGNPFRVDPVGSTTQPISGTVTVNQSTASSLNATVSQNTAANLNATIVGPTADGTVASTSPVLIAGTTDGTGTGTTSIPKITAGGLVSVDGSAVTQPVSGTVTVTQATAANLNITCANCSGSGASGTDEGGFTAGSSIFAPSGGFFQTTATSNPLTTGQWGTWQMTANRAGFVNLRNASGTEIGTSTTPVQVSVANTGANATAMLVTGTGGTFPISGSISNTSFAATQATAASLNATVVGTGTFAVQAAASGSTSNASSAVATSSTNIASIAYNYGFNGTTWDQLQVDGSKNLKTVFSNTTLAVTNAGTFSTQVSSLPALVVGSAIIGKVGIDQTTDGTTNAVHLVAGTALAGKFGIDQTTPGTTNGVQDAATSATGSAVPSKAIYAGAVSSGNIVGIIQADSSAAINVSTATTTQIVALSSGKKIYVTAADIIAGGTGNITFEYGTGTACATGTTVLTGAYPLTAQSGLTKGGGIGPVWVVPASNALCVLTSAGVQMSGSVSYTQF